MNFSNPWKASVSRLPSFLNPVGDSHFDSKYPMSHLVCFLCFFLALLPEKILSSTSNPTASPTCMLQTVTCCFTVDTTFVRLYVDDEELTQQVQNKSNFWKRNKAKVVSFLEPPGPAVIGIVGYNGVEVFFGGLELSCNCARPGSPWNFKSSADSNWTGVLPLNFRDDNFPSGWYTLNYSGPQGPVNVLNQAFHLNTASCGAVTNADKLQAYQSNYPINDYFAFRKVVPFASNCGEPWRQTSSPYSSLPTSSPTHEPTSFSPTSRSPTSKSPTFNPTNRPTRNPTAKPTLRPTLSPITTKPSHSPTLSPVTPQPTTLNPTNSPTISPSTSHPSKSPTTTSPSKSPSHAPSNPTSAPTCSFTGATVTCCFAINYGILQVFVDEINITASITPGLPAWDQPNIVKSVTFPEPQARSALFAVSMYELSEITPVFFGASCVSTRSGSPWTFNSTLQPGDWTTVSSRTNILPNGWYSLNYKGQVKNVTAPIYDWPAPSSQCLPSGIQILQVGNPNTYTGVRRIVTNNC